jgi:hypothetical protein
MPWAAETVRVLFDVLERLAKDDAKGFQEALYAALVAHRNFWGRPDEVEADPGWIAWGVTGLACLAHDRGWPLEIESEYMPASLITRTFED